MIAANLLSWACGLVLLASSASVASAASSGIAVPITAQKLDNEYSSSLSRRGKKGSSHAANATEVAVYNLRTQYLAQINVGTPAQQFNVILDTGSADLWIPGTSCSTNVCPYNRFDPKKSSTLKDLKETFDITYGTAYADGEYVSDSVSLSGVTVEQQTFAIVNDTQGLNSGSKRSNVHPDGILGLGYPGLAASTDTSSIAYSPLLFTMVEQNLIPEPIFSFSMGGEMANIGWTGELVLGGVNSAKYTGDIEYVPVVTDTKSEPYEWWQTYGQSFKVTDGNGTVTATVDFDENRLAVVDSGTTLTYVDMDYAKKVLTGVTGQTNFTVTPSAGIFMVDCKHKDTKARIQFALSGKTSSKSDSSPVIIDFPASSMVIPLDTEDIKTATICGWGMVGTSDGSDFTLGQSLLRNTYLVFDMENNQIGFAASSDTTTTVKASSSSSSKKSKKSKKSKSD